eukprot:CAMPEP_0172500862 /NCGR_PEP_ID=MMETSP1066-20121228/143954_1 /TAXON_ID=671091 /ORGANISM="Coscinodiscus wailesii, Strain CCMP2513" /LENGTH=368 /DNA_ID=CAMNT_0013275343 /DNA_START=30 /DNA_END=1133 /DNA_ORIENTATION=+
MPPPLPQPALPPPSTTTTTTTTSTSTSSPLIEIIHLHDCLRGALRDLENDVTLLSKNACDSLHDDIGNLREHERRVDARFKVIWSVFRAHSAAEDEFIWPALKEKLGAAGMCRLANGGGGDCCGGGGGGGSKKVHCHEGGGIGQEEYEEDHADEERMFLEMDSLLSQMRARLNNSKKRKMASGGDDACRQCPMCDLSKTLKNHTANLSHHLFEHLKKEEVQCMPLVEKHLTRQEIYDLVGNIMGKRSSSIMTQILTMAVQNLSPVEREDMVRSMKQAMVGTFFESWLSSSGCWGDVEATKPPPPPAEESEARHEMTSSGSAPGCGSSEAPSDISQAELEKLIRSVAANPNLTALQKSTTIQGLRDSVW